MTASLYQDILNQIQQIRMEDFNERRERKREKQRERQRERQNNERGTKRMIRSQFTVI